MDRNIPKLFFTTDGLRKLYQLEHEVSDTKANQWWQAHGDKLYQVKTPRWRNKDEVMVDLGIHSGHKDYASFDKVWKQIEREQKSSDPKLSPRKDGIQAGMKRDEVAPSGRTQCCVTVESVDLIRNLIAPQGVDGAGSTRVSGKRGPTAGRM